MKDLQFAISNMKQLLADEVARFDFDRPDLGAALWICTLTRRIGCGTLLADGEPAPAFEGLFRSGEIFLLTLEPLAALGEFGDVARGQSAPMTDALAAGATDLARRIDAHLPNARNADLEDDEDFAWYSAFHGLGVGRLDAVALRETAQGFLATDSEFLVPRGELLRAVAGREAADFDRALAKLTDAWHEGIRTLREGGVTDRNADLTEWNLFLEGAALVRAARERGVPVRAAYPFVPAALLEEGPELPEPLSAGD